MELNKLEEFELLVKGNPIIMVYFYSTWCPPCRMLKPVILEFMEDHPEYPVLMINTDNFKTISNNLKIYNVPTLCWFKAGELVDTVGGYIDYDELVEKFEDLSK